MPVKVLKREFEFNKEILPDPDPTMTPEQVISFYSSKYPELITGSISKTKDTEEGILYIIGHGVGTKA